MARQVAVSSDPAQSRAGGFPCRRYQDEKYYWRGERTSLTTASTQVTLAPAASSSSVVSTRPCKRRFFIKNWKNSKYFPDLPSSQVEGGLAQTVLTRDQVTGDVPQEEVGRPGHAGPAGQVERRVGVAVLQLAVRLGSHEDLQHVDVSSPSSQHQRCPLSAVPRIDLRPLGEEEVGGVEEVGGGRDVEDGEAETVRTADTGRVGEKEVAALLVAAHQGAVQRREAGDVRVGDLAGLSLEQQLLQIENITRCDRRTPLFWLPGTPPGRSRRRSGAG